MPSVKNPNAPSRNRLAARAAKQRKTRQKAAALGQLARQGGAIAKADARRGAKPGLLPTSGPRAAVSKKKQRKLEKQLRHALRRKMEAEGEVEMKGKFCQRIFWGSSLRTC
ncbi:hypothetical protein N657DRAFT_650455 [Parathielavia appendiculata]|uniref:Uncharacterized protein n=1 Tax=Parathielavia appendiculata TaxID=2587402 RepID=A0AAN6YYU6_9PEZI|nr:hypothetical protein N657DRAFT_650455 [Parathielavia appendiculata]